MVEEPTYHDGGGAYISLNQTLVEEKRDRAAGHDYLFPPEQIPSSKAQPRPCHRIVANELGELPSEWESIQATFITTMLFWSLPH